METSFIQQLEFLEKLSDYIKKEAQEIKNVPADPYESEATNEINAALSKAQGEFPSIHVNQENPYFKSAFSDLNNIVKSIRPALAKYGLSFTQQTKICPDGSTQLVTRIRHSSGQWIESRARIIPPKSDIQSYASTLSYMKRYSLASLLGVTIDSDWSDDDAETVMVDQRATMAKGTALNRKYNPKEELGMPITKEQLEMLEYELQEYPDLTEMVLDGLKLQSLADMSQSKFPSALERIRSIKNKRNGIA